MAEPILNPYVVVGVKLGGATEPARPRHTPNAVCHIGSAARVPVVTTTRTRLFDS